jgi:hypothetical protein
VKQTKRGKEDAFVSCHENRPTVVNLTEENHATDLIRSVQKLRDLRWCRYRYPTPGIRPAIYHGAPMSEVPIPL